MHLNWCILIVATFFRIFITLSLNRVNLADLDRFRAKLMFKLELIMKVRWIERDICLKILILSAQRLRRATFLYLIIQNIQASQMLIQDVIQNFASKVIPRKDMDCRGTQIRYRNDLRNLTAAKIWFLRYFLKNINFSSVNIRGNFKLSMEIIFEL